MLLEVCGHKADPSGRSRRFRYTRADGTVREYEVFMGLVDSGFDTDRVYEFCYTQKQVFDPYKGAPHTHTRGSKVRMTKVLDEKLDLWLCWSDYFAAHLYYDCIKWGVAFGKPVLWWLPTDICETYRRHLTDEFQGPDGWTTRTKTNHLGDTEKMHLVFEDRINEALDVIREQRLAEESKGKAK
jgi:hypothetical protein